jgi:hypothetical protein
MSPDEAKDRELWRSTGAHWHENFWDWSGRTRPTQEEAKSTMQKFNEGLSGVLEQTPTLSLILARDVYLSFNTETNRIEEWVSG